MKLRFAKRYLFHKLTAIVLIAIGFAAISMPVYAHYIYENGYTYSSSYDCTWNRAEISHGSGGGYSKADVRSKKKASNLNCLGAFNRPINHLRARYDLENWNGST